MNFKAQWCSLGWQLVSPLTPSSWNQETEPESELPLENKKQMNFSLCSYKLTGEHRKCKDFREQKADKEKSIYC